MEFKPGTKFKVIAGRIRRSHPGHIVLIQRGNLFDFFNCDPSSVARALGDGVDTHFSSTHKRLAVVANVRAWDSTKRGKPWKKSLADEGYSYVVVRSERSGKKPKRFVSEIVNVESNGKVSKSNDAIPVNAQTRRPVRFFRGNRHNPEANTQRKLKNEILHEYLPKRLLGNETDQKLHINSDRILKLKEECPYAISYYVGELRNQLEDLDFIVCCVPSHKSSAEIQAARRLNSCPNGIVKVAKELCKSSSRIDGTSVLERCRSIKKKSQGGSRSIDVDLKSIRVIDSPSVKNQPVLLLDDVTTTGNSLDACCQLLINSGAYCVQPLAIAQTRGNS